jgi:hypothetical protein
MSPKVYSYAIETVNGLERPDFGPNYNLLSQKVGIENEIAERFEQVTNVLDQYSEYTITNHVWINTNWWMVIEKLSDIYQGLVNRLPYEPEKVPHVNYVGDLIQMVKLIKNWCEENGLTREMLEENRVDKQEIFLVLI